MLKWIGEPRASSSDWGKWNRALVLIVSKRRVSKQNGGMGLLFCDFWGTAEILAWFYGTEGAAVP